MNGAKPVSTLLEQCYRLEHEMYETGRENMKGLQFIYQSVFCSLMYDVICTIPDIAQSPRALAK